MRKVENILPLVVSRDKEKMSANIISHSCAGLISARRVHLGERMLWDRVKGYKRWWANRLKKSSLVTTVLFWIMRGRNVKQLMSCAYIRQEQFPRGGGKRFTIHDFPSPNKMLESYFKFLVSVLPWILMQPLVTFAIEDER